MPKSNKTIYEETIERARFFQTVQAWPISDKLNYEGWLTNFDTDHDRNIACLILDFFTYYSASMVGQMLKTSVGLAGQDLSRDIDKWKHSDFKNRCLYSFIPGECPSPTDSGHFFTRILRDELGIPEVRIIDYSLIPQTLDSIKQTTPVILVDDFASTFGRHTLISDYD